MSRKTNAAGIALIKRWEGCRLTAYQDSVKVWTIGYGHTAAAGAPTPKAGMTITAEEAESILKADLGQYEDAVSNAVKVALNDNQFAALVSFTFNLGPANLRSSTLLKKLNAGDYVAVPGEMAKWNKAGGKVLAGLTNRRADEAKLWNTAVASSTVAPADSAPVASNDNAPAGFWASLAAKFKRAG